MVKRGVDKVPRKVLLDYKRKKAKSLHKLGYSVREIAEELSLSVGTISGYLNLKDKIKS